MKGASVKKKDDTYKMAEALNMLIISGKEEKWQEKFALKDTRNIGIMAI